MEGGWKANSFKGWLKRGKGDMDIETQDDGREEKKTFTYLRWFVSDGFTSQRYPVVN